MAETATAPAPTPPDDDEKMDTKDPTTLDAETHLLEARTALIQARWSFWDRLVMRGLIPLATLVAGPAVGYYFHERAEKSDANQEQLKSLIASNQKLVQRLEQILVIAAARREVASVGKDAFTQAINATDQPNLATIRAEVEKSLVARVVGQLGSDEPVVKPAISKAVDEIVPELETLIKAKVERR